MLFVCRFLLFSSNAQGVNSRQSYSEASKWLHMAAAQNHAAAMHKLGCLVEKKHLPCDVDSEMDAACWYDIRGIRGSARPDCSLMFGCSDRLYSLIYSCILELSFRFLLPHRKCMYA
jgi:hypothetical protein